MRCTSSADPLFVGVWRNQTTSDTQPVVSHSEGITGQGAWGHRSADAVGKQSRGRGLAQQVACESTTQGPVVAASMGSAACVLIGGTSEAHWQAPETSKMKILVTVYVLNAAGLSCLEAGGLQRVIASAKEDDNQAVRALRPGPTHGYGRAAWRRLAWNVGTLLLLSVWCRGGGS